MDESLHTLEAELKSLSLPRPSVSLMDRLEADLSISAENNRTKRRRYTTSTNLNSWKWSGWRVAGLAATLALVTTLGLLRVQRQPPEILAAAPATIAAAAPTAPSTANHYQPIAATNVLYDLADEGAVSAPGDNPTRRVRARYLDTYTWKNPTTNASIRWSVPRDEIRLVSATLN
jgi:hypothetical protein